MQFSVVVPTHKRKKLLLALLDSLKNQSLSKDQFEVILVATEGDEAFDIDLSTYPLEIRREFVPNDPSGGKSASVKRNHGASLARSEWIAFIDDDCLADPEWLSEAQKVKESSNVDFMEGGVIIPVPEKKTFTFKGIQRLGRPGGFQTCNMFYKKDAFLEIGGFDLNFPYYLEDTDLAWSFLDKGYKQQFAEKAKVSHPVPPSDPSKMLESAFRARKLPYLYKKHPKLFKNSGMRAYTRSFLPLVIIDFAMIASLLFAPQWLIFLLISRLFIAFSLLMRMMKGCHKDFKEITSMYYYLMICPLISFFALIRGNIEQGVWIFLK